LRLLAYRSLLDLYDVNAGSRACWALTGTDTDMARTASTPDGTFYLPTTRERYRKSPACYATATAKDLRWIQQTLALAASSQHGTRMGALAVQGGRVVAQSVNRRRNPPSAVPWVHCSFHAEEGLVRARPDLTGSTVYVARLTTAGRAALARPCSECHASLCAAGVRRTVWTASANTVGVETFHSFMP
jgi:tRNA(Arg) A34 adenosine deaminase TadA